MNYNLVYIYCDCSCRNLSTGLWDSLLMAIVLVTLCSRPPIEPMPLLFWRSAKKKISGGTYILSLLSLLHQHFFVEGLVRCYKWLKMLKGQKLLVLLFSGWHGHVLLNHGFNFVYCNQFFKKLREQKILEFTVQSKAKYCPWRLFFFPYV